MQQLLSRGGLKVNLDFRYTETQPLYIYIQNGRATLVMVYVILILGYSLFLLH